MSGDRNAPHPPQFVQKERILDTHAERLQQPLIFLQSVDHLLVDVRVCDVRPPSVKGDPQADEVVEWIVIRKGSRGKTLIPPVDQSLKRVDVGHASTPSQGRGHPVIAQTELTKASRICSSERSQKIGKSVALPAGPPPLASIRTTLRYLRSRAPA